MRFRRISRTKSSPVGRYITSNYVYVVAVVVFFECLFKNRARCQLKSYRSLKVKNNHFSLRNAPFLMKRPVEIGSMHM